jgi:hypothetical protein
VHETDQAITIVVCPAPGHRAGAGPSEFSRTQHALWSLLVTECEQLQVRLERQFLVPEPNDESCTVREHVSRNAVSRKLYCTGTCEP